MNKNEDSCPDGETNDFSAPFIFHSSALRESFNQEQACLEDTTFWCIASCRVLRTHRCFGGAYCLDFHGLPKKHMHLCTNIKGVMSHKTGFAITAVGRTSNLLSCWIFVYSSCNLNWAYSSHCVVSWSPWSVCICNILKYAIVHTMRYEFLETEKRYLGNRRPCSTRVHKSARHLKTLVTIKVTWSTLPYWAPRILGASV